MYTSLTVFFAAIVALARLALAAIPACLIGALGAQSNPSDLKGLCGSLEQQFAANITEKCSGNAESSAMSIFSATCLASESITIKIISTSASGPKTGSVAASTTNSGSDNAVSTGSSTGTSSGSSASPTKKSSGSSVSPHSAFIITPVVVAAAFAGYIL